MASIVPPREVDYDALYRWCRTHGLELIDLFRGRVLPTLRRGADRTWWRVLLPTGGEALIVVRATARPRGWWHDLGRHTRPFDR
jgi:hypothetical protein